MKLFALALVLFSSSSFAANCFMRLDSDIGLRLSRLICFNSVMVDNGVAYVSASFDGIQKMKKIVVGKGTQTANGTVYKLEDLESIYISERPECSRAFEGHVDAQITVTKNGVSYDKLSGVLVEKGDYCYDDGQVIGTIRYSKN